MGIFVHNSDEKLLNISVEDNTDNSDTTENGVLSNYLEKSFKPFKAAEVVGMDPSFLNNNAHSSGEEAESTVPFVENDIPWRGLSDSNSFDSPVPGVLLASREAATDEQAAVVHTPYCDGIARDESELVLGVKLRQYAPVYFFKAGQETVQIGSKVLIDTNEGISLAEVVIVRRLCKPLPKIRTEDGSEVDIEPIRGLAGPENIAAAADNQILAASARLYCKECIRSRNLDMKLVDVEVLHDRSKIIFYFTAPIRIDFRELVKDLVRNYHTRIELRQIGVRHETQMLGALGNCGMTCCCRRYLHKFAPVTIKMAKEQNLFLNVAKLSGICGRLLCCLSYEQENYDEFHKRCPKIGKKFNTDKGMVKIVRANLFRQSIVILDDSNQETELQLDEWDALHPARFDIVEQDSEKAANLFVKPVRVSENIPDMIPVNNKDVCAPKQDSFPFDGPSAFSQADDFSENSSDTLSIPPEDPMDVSETELARVQIQVEQDTSIFGLPGSGFVNASARQNRKNKNSKQNRHRR
jgi:cell fate regulator YaaT (PSP1 superfamily)